MRQPIRLETVTAENVEQLGFFCYKSKPHSAGYQRKLAWLRERFAEGLQIKILYDGQRSAGFIEYIQGEKAWRAVEAPGQMVIHCLWVVSSGKGKGYGSRLLQACLDDANAAGMRGVVMLTSARTWLAGKRLFQKHGFESVGKAPPSFDLMALRMGAGPLPGLATNWEDRAAAFGPGLTVVFTRQCPYIEGSVQAVRKAAEYIGAEFQSVELGDSDELRKRSPTAYGVFAVIHDGKLPSYHPIGTKDLLKRLH